MISVLRSFVKSLPTLLLSFALAVAVWISAVNAADPIRSQVFPRPITIDRSGLDPSLVITNEVPKQVTVTLSAPNSVWNRIVNGQVPVRAWIDLAGLTTGTHTVDVHVQPVASSQPLRVVSQSPNSVTVTLEKQVTQSFAIHLIRRGEPAVGFQTDTPKINPDHVTISGPNSLVSQVKDVQVVLDLTQVSDNITRKLLVQPLDENGNVIQGVTVDPAEVTVTQPISQRGGYRNVVVKVASTGQVSSGYRLTNISVFPPTITVFSPNPQLINQLPGYVETSPLDLTGIKDDIDRRLPLNLPNGVEVVGDQTVLVQVGVAAIEGSLTLSGLPVQVTNMPADMTAKISPESVDVIISGPVPLLDRLNEGDVRVFLDLSGVAPGTYQFAPKVNLAISELKLESILPSSIEVVVASMAGGTVFPSATPSLTPTPSETVTPTPTPRR